MPDTKTTSVENQEFRECAEQMWREMKGFSESVYMCSEDREGVDLLTRAMRIAAEEALEMCKQSTYLAGGNGAIRQMKSSSVASRISSRIKGEK